MGNNRGQAEVIVLFIGQIETQGTVSAQWVGTDKFVNYAWMPHMPASDKKWQMLIAELFFSVEKLFTCLTLLSHKGGLLLFHLCNIKIYCGINSVTYWGCAPTLTAISHKSRKYNGMISMLCLLGIEKKQEIKHTIGKHSN